MKIAAYIRVSTDRQVDHGDSIDNQLKLAEQWCEKKGYELAHIYDEGGASAYRDKRRVFKEMLLDIKLGKIQVDGVLVYSLSRFARTLGGQYEADKLLQAFGVRLLSIIEDIPQQNPMSAYIFKNLVGLTNELQSMQNSAAVQDAMDENARQGFHNGQTTPFGYRIIETDIPARNGYKKRLGIDSENSKIVKHIFHLALYGDSGTPWGVKSICNYLNESGYQEKGRKWNINKVSRILRDTVYIG